MSCPRASDVQVSSLANNASGDIPCLLLKEAGRTASAPPAYDGGRLPRRPTLRAKLRV